MGIQRENSIKTWNKLDHTLAKIRQIAAARRDDEIYGLADNAILLLRNLGNDLYIEDKATTSQQAS